MKNLLFKIVLSGISIIALPFVLWNITFGFIAGYALLILMISGLYFSLKKNTIKHTVIAIATGFILYIALLPVTIPKLNKTQLEYQKKVTSNNQLSIIEKWNVYGLNITMGIVAMPIYPEVGIETLFMMIPTSDGKREFESDFFMKSKKLTRAFKSKKRGKVGWSGKYYNDKDEARVSLALNACKYNISKTKDGNTKYSVVVPIKYPQRKFETKLNIGPLSIYVQEGLFGYLERVGWLFKYKAIWTHIETT